ncbi:MAG: FKBP-type peptidyl-prolyl cis-trans isomerase [Akkermansiaceae bacterium]|jgi:FKBP-type peptidyl-prolyl cis-trans isomerase
MRPELPDSFDLDAAPHSPDALSMTFWKNSLAALSCAAFSVTSCSESLSSKPSANTFAPVPSNAETTYSGLQSVVLQPGNGGLTPHRFSTVTAHYTGWTTDGKMFDSSIPRGQPSSFPLGNVIPGWTEGLQLMSVGEKRRFWIPANLAYGNNPGGGKPSGTLVFDVELLGFQ